MRINELTIYTNKLQEQIEFYSSVLGLNCVRKSESEASFQLGNSILTFVSKDNTTPYHFAINIPSNKEHAALNWLKDRVDILKAENVELHDFDFWNAKAMYFYDEDQNIVEFIARKNLYNESDLPFDSDQLLSISEIGLPTLDIKSKFEWLNELSGIEPFSGDYDRFLAIGDDHGLFICVNKRIKDWFPTGDAAHSSDFELDFSANAKNYRIRFENGTLYDLARHAAL